jgi:NADPH:quinone reductase-like Zn-dependent oxidoreductase
MAAMTVRAVRIHEYGGPEKLVYEDAPRPEPGEGEISIRVYVVDGHRKAGLG